MFHLDICDREKVSGPTIFSLANIAPHIFLLAYINKEHLAVATNRYIKFLHKPNLVEEIVSDGFLFRLGRILTLGEVFVKITKKAYFLARSFTAHFRLKVASEKFLRVNFW